jgi:DNA repair protein RadB
MEYRSSSGSKVIDGLLEGGWDSHVISTVFGPAGSAKSVICLLSLIAQTQAGKKVVFIDTEGNFSIERLKQLTPDHKDVLDNTVFILPTTFEEQKKAISGLAKSLPPKVGMVIVDTISMLYRYEFGKREMQELNRELGEQLSQLIQIARKTGIPVLMTNQVYSDPEAGTTRMIGGDILKYASKTIVELKSLASAKREAIIRKHRSLPQGRKVMFEIKQEGLAPFRM